MRGSYVWGAAYVLSQQLFHATTRKHFYTFPYLNFLLFFNFLSIYTHKLSGTELCQIDLELPNSTTQCAGRESVNLSGVRLKRDTKTKNMLENSDWAQVVQCGDSTSAN